MSRINMVMYQGKIHKIEEKTHEGKLIVEIRMRQSYPKVAGRKLDNPTQDDFRTEWITAVCYGDTAKLARDTLKPNDWVTVQGRLRHNEWVSKTGEKRSNHTIVASFLHRTPGTFTDATNNTLSAEMSAGFEAPRTNAPAVEDEVPF